MKILEIDAATFNDYAKKHTLRSYFQTAEYASLMSYTDYSIMYIGGYHDGKLMAASLILYKKIAPTIKYGYAPRGFLVDYYKTNLTTAFFKKVKEFFAKKNYAFIKINPEVTYAILDYEKKTKVVNKRNKELIKELKTFGCEKLKDNLYFESLLPKYNPIIYLKDYDFNSLNEELKERIDIAHNRGLEIRKGSMNDIETFFKFVKDKRNKTIDYYKYFYNSFAVSNMVELTLVEMDYTRYSKLLQKEYLIAEEKKNKANTEFELNIDSEKMYNNKISADKYLSEIKSQIEYVNNRMDNSHPKEVVAGAMIVKTDNRVTILINGHNKEFSLLFPKEYLFYKILDAYKNEGYPYLDMNGITGDLGDNNPYKDLNEFKLSFNPTVYEYIGEFDFVVNKAYYQLLWTTNKLQKEFYKDPNQKN